ncbi:MAG: putative secreted protein [Frankiales bacterium]|nr:putative secreted protein [Frankiales bacterium]
MRVLTLNIWARSGPYAVREGLLRRLLGDLAPDLIALQEVDAGPGESNQAEELLEPLGYQVAYERREGENRADPGIAVASRHPIRARRLIELPHGGAAVAARIDSGGDPFWFCSAVPMPIWPHQEGGREDEVVALDAALTELADGDALPPILAGDFDATPDAASVRFLTGLQSLQGRSTAWTDAFAVAGNGTPGWTWTSKNPYAAPFAAAVFAQPIHHRRIDYVFIGSPFRWRPRVVVRSCRVALTGTPEAAPSDHYGVLADLEFDGVPLGGGRGLAAWHETAAALWPPAP